MTDTASLMVELKKLREADVNNYDEWGERSKENKNNLTTKPQPKKAVKDYTNKKYEQRLSKGTITSTKYMQVFRGPKTVYDFLWAHIVRGDMTNDKLNIKAKYYNKNKLACSYPTSVIANACGLDIKTVKNYINILLRAGFIKKEQIKINKIISQNIYILGEWRIKDSVLEETLYVNEVCEK
jgi:hypothetical protein